ncbi:MAG: helix-turn-helix transcriptional regulator [Vicinamibacterales bacterium]
MNLHALLRAEIGRLARKEVRAETDALKKAVGRYRSDIAELKRQIAGLSKELKRVAKGSRGAAPSARDDADEGSQLRFNAGGLASNRKRLGLSAEAYGQLLGVTGQSIYKWEAGKARPRRSMLPAIAELRTIGKKEAEARLASLPPA